jgi:hypothetical protein
VATVEVPTPTVTAPGAPAVPTSVAFAPLEASELTVTVTAADQRTTIDRRYGEAVVLPVAIAELGLPAAASATPLPARFDSGCRTDLVSVDGAPVPVRIQGTTSDLLARQPLDLTSCTQGGSSAPAVTLSAGTHVLRTAPGKSTGLDLDRLVLRSAAGGGPAALTGASPGSANAGGSTPPAAPVVTVEHQGRTSLSGQVTGASEPYWLVLGEGRNDGWRATLDGRDLGPPQAIDGGMNGWLISGPVAATARFTMTWTPQRWVVGGLVVSGLSIAICLVLLLLPRRRRPQLAAASGDESATIRRQKGVRSSTWGDEAEGSPTFVGLRASGPPATWPVALGAGLAIGVITALVLPPAYALLTLPATVVALRRPALRRIPAIGAVTCFGLVAAYYVVRLVVSAPAAGFGWTSAFERAHPIALLGVVLIAADALVAALRRRRSVHYPPPEPTRPEPR